MELIASSFYIFWFKSAFFYPFFVLSSVTSSWSQFKFIYESFLQKTFLQRKTLSIENPFLSFISGCRRFRLLSSTLSSMSFKQIQQKHQNKFSLKLIQNFVRGLQVFGQKPTILIRTILVITFFNKKKWFTAPKVFFVRSFFSN